MMKRYTSLHQPLYVLYKCLKNSSIFNLSGSLRVVDLFLLIELLLFLLKNILDKFPTLSVLYSGSIPPSDGGSL